jgi:hypothetical protein
MVNILLSYYFIFQIKKVDAFKASTFYLFNVMIQ